MCRAWACTSMMVRAHSDHPKLNMFFLPFAPFHRVLGFRDRFQLRCDLSLLNQRPAESTSVANLSLSTNSDKTKKISRETSLLRATTHATPVPPFPGRTSRVTIMIPLLHNNYFTCMYYTKVPSYLLHLNIIFITPPYTAG